MRQLRILCINNRYWPTLGGAETYVRELAVRFVADRDEVTVLTTDALDYDLLWHPRRRRLAQLEEQHEGIRILRFPVHHLPGSPAAYQAWRIMLRYASSWQLTSIGLLMRLARVTPWVPSLWRWLADTRERFDVVAGFAVLYEPLIEAGLLYAQQQKVPFVFCPLTHLGTGPRPGQDNMSCYYTMRHQIALARQSAAILTMTRAESDFLKSQGVPPERLHVVGAGVNPDDVIGGDGAYFRASHNLAGPVIAFLSTMTPDKGAVHLVEAVRALWRTGREVNLVMAGRMTTLFQQYLDRLPIEDRRRLHVLGFVSAEDKRDLLAAADMLVMPSRSDSFGIIYLEAWLCRKPVIAARAWGMSDVIDEGGDGLLVPFGDATALAQAIGWMLDHPDERLAMGERGERKVRQAYTWAHKYAVIRELFLRLVRC